MEVSMILDLPKDVEETLACQARAVHMPAEEYVAKLVERAVENRRLAAAERLNRHLDDMASCIAPETTIEEMEAAIEEALLAVRPKRVW
jgi:hypothetical protein